MEKLSNRIELVKLLPELNLNGIGAEVGVWKGDFSQDILKFSRLKKLYSIDAWNLKACYMRSKWSQFDLDLAYYTSSKLLSNFKNRSEIIKLTSEEASQCFANDTFDFIHLDAAHDYDNVVKDIRLWWNKVKAGGILSGHDYMVREDGEVEFGVIEAVNEHAERYSLKLNLTKGKFATWYFFKPIRKPFYI